MNSGNSINAIIYFKNTIGGNESIPLKIRSREGIGRVFESTPRWLPLFLLEAHLEGGSICRGRDLPLILD